MEVIDIGLGDLDTINISLNDTPAIIDDIPSLGGETKATSDFGGGMEFLMNDKKRSANSTVHLDLGDIDDLEKDLNNLTGGQTNNNNKSVVPPATAKSGGGLGSMVSNFFGFGDDSSSSGNNNNKGMGNKGYEKTDSKLGQSTASAFATGGKTWDGFTKANDIPSSSSSSSSRGASMSEKDRRRKKREMLQKLEEFNETKKFKHMSSANLTMDSSYEDIEEEYEACVDEKRRKESVKLQKWWLMAFVNTLEFANTALNPFDIDLSGFGDKVTEELDTYDEIFGELHEKYRGGKMSPEVALLLKLGVSAATVSISNKALSSAAPGFQDIVKQSPELMRLWTDATVKSMGQQQQPGFGFASNLMGQQSHGRGGGGAQHYGGYGNDDINTAFGPPPKPIETKSQPAPTRPGQMAFQQQPSQQNEIPVNRPDLAFGRGAMFREDLNNNNNNNNNGIPRRPEMKGPQTTDFDSLLSGLKSKNGDNLSANQTNTNTNTNVNQNNNNVHEINLSTELMGLDESMVSVSSLKDLSSSSMPRRNNKRSKAESRNTVSLDI